MGNATGDALLGTPVSIAVRSAPEGGAALSQRGRKIGLGMRGTLAAKNGESQNDGIPPGRPKLFSTKERSDAVEERTRAEPR